MKENLELWNNVNKTDPEFTKKVSYGTRKFTAIDPTYQIKNATEMFGRYGTTWGIRDIDIEIIETVSPQKVAILTCEFFTPEGTVSTGNSISIVSVKGATDTDFLKKIITNTISKELSRLGFNADVFLGKFDDERYVNMLKDSKNNDELEKHKTAISLIDKVPDLKKYWDKNKGAGVEFAKLIGDRKKVISTENENS